MHFLPVLVTGVTVLTVSSHPLLATRQSGNFLSLPFRKQKHSHGASLGRRALDAPLNNEFYHYNIDFAIGTPPQAVTVLLDTGSSDIWLYAPGVCENCTEPAYDPNSSSTETTLSDQGAFQISYGSTDGVVGYYASDVLTLDGVAVTQIIGVATTAYPGTPDGGIMGIGLPQGQSLAEADDVAPYPGYLDTLKSNGVIDTRAYSVYLNDQSPGDEATGTIIFGGDNPSARVGDLVAFDIVVPAPDGAYRLDIDPPAMNIVVDGQTYSLPASQDTYTINLDTGNSLTFFPEDQFEALITLLNTTGQVELAETDIGWFEASLPCALSEADGGIDFYFSGLTENLVIGVPWSELVLPIDGESDICMLGIASMSEQDADGVYGFGDTFLRSVFVLYNFDAGTISLAQASYDASPDEVVEI